MPVNALAAQPNGGTGNEANGPVETQSDAEEPVAQVGDETYTAAEFETAVENGQIGGNVKLLRDYTLALGDKRIELKADLTIDLNDRTLTVNTTSTNAVYASGVNLSVTNGTLSGSAGSYLIYFTPARSRAMSSPSKTPTASAG